MEIRISFSYSFLLIVRNLKLDDKCFEFSKKTIQYIENLTVSM